MDKKMLYAMLSMVASMGLALWLMGAVGISVG
jgi:hypothetical protein